MIKNDSSSTPQSAYVFPWSMGGAHSNLSSSFFVSQIPSINASESDCFCVGINSYEPLIEQESNSNLLKVSDLLSVRKKQLYTIMAQSSIDDDSNALSYFEEMREENDDSQCFGQILDIFLGAYKEKDDPMVVKTLRFMQNFRYDEIKQVAISASRLALIDSKSLDIQSAALSLALCWKSKEFRSILDEYKAPKDPFINIKMKKIKAWCTSEK